jgi:hypothetical protein
VIPHSVLFFSYKIQSYPLSIAAKRTNKIRPLVRVRVRLFDGQILSVVRARPICPRVRVRRFIRPCPSGLSVCPCPLSVRVRLTYPSVHVRCPSVSVRISVPNVRQNARLSVSVLQTSRLNIAVYTVFVFLKIGVRKLRFKRFLPRFHL